MNKISNYLRDCAVTVVLLLVAFGLSLLCQKLDVEEHTTTVFVFAVFLISLITNGYIYGVLAAFAGTLAVNYALTFPYFSLNFTIPVNLISAVVLIVLAVLTVLWRSASPIPAPTTLMFTWTGSLSSPAP
jgi:two-component system sensor histidine kinase KdpD